MCEVLGHSPHTTDDNDVPFSTLEMVHCIHLDATAQLAARCGAPQGRVELTLEQSLLLCIGRDHSDAADLCLELGERRQQLCHHTSLGGVADRRPNQLLDAARDVNKEKWWQPRLLRPARQRNPKAHCMYRT